MNLQVERRAVSSTNRGTIWICKGWIGVSKSSEKSSRSVTFSFSIFIARFGRQVQWTSWRNAIRLKVRCFSGPSYNWVIFLNEHCVSLDNHCYSVVDLKHYSPLTQSAPFSNSATTSSFQIEKNSGSRLPILKIKTDSVLERPHLSFTARENMKAGENGQKIAVKSGAHTENDRFFRIFEFKKTVFIYFLIFLRLRLKVLIHHCFPKRRAWKLRLKLLKNRKAYFTSPTRPIWALSLLILGYSKHARIQIRRFDDYE